MRSSVIVHLRGSVDDAGIGQHLVRIYGSDDSPRVHANQAVRDLQQHMHDVLDPDDGDAAPVQHADGLDQLGSVAVSQAAADLVEQQHDRIGGKCPRQLEPFAIEQAERLGAAIGQLDHAAQAQRIDAARAGLVAAEPATVRGGGQHVLEHRHAAEGARDLVGTGDTEAAALCRVEPRHVFAEKGDRSHRRGIRAGEHVQQRRTCRRHWARRCRSHRPARH
jgi:hypothetical protein